MFIEVQNLCRIQGYLNPLVVTGQTFATYDVIKLKSGTWWHYRWVVCAKSVLVAVLEECVF